MRRFFIAVFVLSLIASAAALYWRTYLPEATFAVEDASPAAPSGDATRSLSTERSLREFKAPSSRQDLALTISILSSIISAIAALAQTWITARAYRR
jgi:hypothetical protein